MVAARQFEVNECKSITTEKEKLLNVVARSFHNKIEHGFAYHLSVPWQNVKQSSNA